MPVLDLPSIVETYWASFFDCPAAELFAVPCRTGVHGPELEGYWGVSALFREGKVMISLPPGSEALLAAPLSQPDELLATPGFAAAFAPLSVLTLGPAYVGYATEIRAPAGSARSLTPEDSGALAELEAACGTVEWEHSGSPVEHPCSGVFLGDRLVALAGYEVWGGSIAHISIVTHPGFRSQGHAREAVAHLAHRALAAGLLPQYRTLEANAPSIRVAEALGFEKYAVSMAVRLSADGTRPESVPE